MKIGLSKSDKKIEGSVEADVERIAEKAMDLHEKDWKDKFITKHKAKVELTKINNNQQIEMEKIKSKRKNYIQKIIEEKRHTKELELEYQKQKEEEERKDRQKSNVVKTILSIILGIIGFPLMIIGFIAGSTSGNPDSGLYAISLVGMFIVMIIPIMWNSNK